MMKALRVNAAAMLAQGLEESFLGMQKYTLVGGQYTQIIIVSCYQRNISVSLVSTITHHLSSICHGGMLVIYWFVARFIQAFTKLCITPIISASLMFSYIFLFQIKKNIHVTDRSMRSIPTCLQ